MMKIKITTAISLMWVVVDLVFLISMHSKAIGLVNSFPLIPSPRSLLFSAIGTPEDNGSPTTSTTATSSTITTPTTSTITTTPASIIEKRTETEWKELLTPEQYYVLREEGTEGPNTSQLNNIKGAAYYGDEENDNEKNGNVGDSITSNTNVDTGVFICAGCNAPLFTAATKYDSGTGWPSFVAPIDNGAVTQSTDFKVLVPRTECSCGTCGGHLGHVFSDGPPTSTTGQRFCMNGIAMNYVPAVQDPILYAAVQERQHTDPYTVQFLQILPTVMINGILGGLFFNAFITNMEMNHGLSSSLPITQQLYDGLPLLPAIYFGVIAVRNCDRLTASLK